MKTMRTFITRLSVFAFALVGLNGFLPATANVAAPSACALTVFTRPNTKLRDHTLFKFGDYFYLAAIANINNSGEQTFAYARTKDFCEWQSMGAALTVGKTGSPDESKIWAPHVVQEGDTFYMFYTGVTNAGTQSIMLATSKNPADPSSWVKQGVVFVPNHAGMIYPGPGSFSDARDAMVLKYNGVYYMYYTGRDQTGGILGVAKSNSINGPWIDYGAMLALPANEMPESPYVIERNNKFYLYYNHTGIGEVYRVADLPIGLWANETKEPSYGWANDFYNDNGQWYASYIYGDADGIKVEPLRWGGSPERPLIGYMIHMPVTTNNLSTN